MPTSGFFLVIDAVKKSAQSNGFIRLRCMDSCPAGVRVQLGLR